MSRVPGLAWWAAALLSLPLVLPLALHTRRRALRLAPASGPQHGCAGVELAGEPFRLLVLGESTVVGVGAACLEYALPGRLAQALSGLLNRPVCWRACGENGITAGEAVERLLPGALEQPADLVLLVFGVNDCTHLSTAAAWCDALRRLALAFQAGGARVAFSGVPPLQHFSALPWLLRQLLGWRAQLLDGWLRELAQDLGAEYCPLTLEFVPGYLAVDGYHPSGLGYRVWAQGLAPLLTEPRPAPPV